ncbi:MAG: hypothetical protein KA954_01260 [Chitinophagales bacterium]|nr:hypothetical protein [Chitinophagales bacterium]MBP9845839.1 hypothetical protein [Saprospiraceae bacterium]
MLITKSTPVGIDVSIQQLQTKLHGVLMSKWGLNPAIAAENKLYKCYGRCYRNKKEGSYIAEVFTEGNDYKEVYWDDNLNVLSFFGISNSIKHELKEKVNVHLIFFVNLKKLKPDLTTRGDEEVRADVIKLMQSANYGFQYLSVDLWLENVLKEYTGSFRENRLKVVDMHPIHCFRLNFSLTYNINQTNCP